MPQGIKRIPLRELKASHRLVLGTHREHDQWLYFNLQRIDRHQSMIYVVVETWCGETIKYEKRDEHRTTVTVVDED